MSNLQSNPVALSLLPLLGATRGVARRAGEVARLLLVSLFDYFPYRLLINLFRIHGMFDFFRQRAGWGELQRRGFAEPERAPARPV